MVPVVFRVLLTVIAPALVRVATLAPVLSLLAFHRKLPSTVGRVKPERLVEVVAATALICTNWRESGSAGGPYQMKVLPVELWNHIWPTAGEPGGVSEITDPGGTDTGDQAWFIRTYWVPSLGASGTFALKVFQLADVR